MLNDFEANGYGVTALEPEHVVVLNDVPPVDKVHLCSPEMQQYSLLAACLLHASEDAILLAVKELRQRHCLQK